ncbi:MAG: hypothetical protein ACUVXA_08045 [Candidatus Jordarchaeum sp.]|uniref:hypothetical protein n=1 Tax=Candidatus Jordarchaeum sp. TaxID=2823881 RepID=UPI00404A4CBB
MDNLDFDALFLSLPEELGESLNLHSIGQIDKEEFWNDYITLTGLATPFANSLRYKLEPIIDKLPLIKLSHDFEISCFEDLHHHTRLRGFMERLLLQEFKSRATGKIDTNEWRVIFREELEAIKQYEEKIIGNILEKGLNYKNSVIIYAGFVKNLKRGLGSNYNVKVICLENYWKSPLEVLKTLFTFRGVDNISDNIVRLCVHQHLKYLDYILLHENVDTSHDVWVKDFKPFKKFQKIET